ncbi:MAG TPA: hypothetical protein VM118_10335, partial [Acidobacteriota bacterium]|nr:hypothetical protein [Acidobacteriota bacterium]
MTLLPALVAVREAPCQPVDSIPGVRVSIEVTEILHADPPETAVIDTLVADVPFDLETTLRVGNFVLFLTATPKPPDEVRLQCGLHPFGPATAPRFDEAAVQFGAPLIVDDIAGKGKSTYRALITPQPTQVAVGMAPPLSDADSWQRQSGAFYVHYATPFSLAYFHYPQLHSIIDGEFGAMRDTFALTTPGRASVYVIEGASPEFPYDPRFDFAVDPARNRIAARYDNLVSGLDAQALLLLGLYRWWGYAPDLLAVGASGYMIFADYDVIADRDAENAIPLDSLALTRDFKRHDPDVAFHHAASFVGWLIRTQGMNTFRECYRRATDLSLGRALWAGYDRTLAELEREWQASLDGRRFTVEEYHQFATRARYYHRTKRHLSLLEQAAAASDSVRPGIWYDLALAQGHAGRWDDAAITLQDLVVSRPDILTGQVLLGEALWALGDRVHAALVLNAVLQTDSLLAQA